MNQIADYYDTYWRQEKDLNFFRYERNQILPLLFQNKEVVLDLGCGDGTVAHYLKKAHQADVTGVDFSFTALYKARQKSINVIQASLETTLPFKNFCFDVVFWGDVIEHLFNPKRALKEIYRVLKPQGRLILSCPNMGYWRYRLHYFLKGNIPETEWINQELWLSQHIRFFNKQLLYQLLKKYCFQPIKFIGISRRRLDQPLKSMLPSLFGMIMVVEAVKQQ